MRITRVLGLALVAPFLVTACGGGGGTSAPASPADPASSTATSSSSTSSAALTLSAGTSATTCLIGPSQTDYGWYDVTWTSATELRDVTVDLSATGLRTVGDPTSLPLPTGRIPFAGVSTWQRIGNLSSSSAVDYAGREAVDRLTPAAGDSGLFLLHLRLDRQAVTGIRPARLTGLTVHYTEDGTPGTAAVALDQTFTRRGPGC